MSLDLQKNWVETTELLYTHQFFQFPILSCISVVNVLQLVQQC